MVEPEDVINLEVLGEDVEVDNNIQFKEEINSDPDCEILIDTTVFVCTIMYTLFTILTSQTHSV